jgi:hypothetical protein
MSFVALFGPISHHCLWPHSRRILRRMNKIETLALLSVGDSNANAMRQATKALQARTGDAYYGLTTPETLLRTALNPGRASAVEERVTSSSTEKQVWDS